MRPAKSEVQPDVGIESPVPFVALTMLSILRLSDEIESAGGFQRFDLPARKASQDVRDPGL